MYKCKPERNVMQAVLLLCSSIVLTVGTFSLGALLPSQRGVINLIGVLVLSLAIYTVIRFTLTEMEYTLDGGTFIITKIVGNKRTVQGALDLADTIALVDKQEYRAKGLNKGLSTICNYSQNLGGNHWFYVFAFSGKRAVVEFEPNDAFVALFREEIRKAKSSDNDAPQDGHPADDLLI